MATSDSYRSIMIDMVSQAITSEATTQRTGENETRPPLEPRGFRSLEPRGFRMPGVDDDDDDDDSPDARGVRRPLPLPPPRDVCCGCAGAHLTSAARALGQVGPPPGEPGTEPTLSARAPAPRQPPPPQGAADSTGAGCGRCAGWGDPCAAVTRAG